MAEPMSVDTRTPAPHLSLVRTPPNGSHRRPSGERLRLPPSPRLTAFVAAAAEAGLGPSEATRLALERALALADAGVFPFDVEVARRRLRRAAKEAHPCRPLTPAQAAYMRTLSPARPRPPINVSAGLVVELPDRVLTRSRDTVAEAALHAGAVPEMVAWEIAATLAGRTMGEWALRTLAGSVAA